MVSAQGPILILAVIGGIVVFGVVLWHLAKRLGSAALAAVVPPRIHLVLQDSKTMPSTPPLEAPQNAFKALGFEKIGHFTVAEMPGVQLIAMTNPQNKLWAIVNEHPKAGVFLEVAAHYEDGTVLSAGNSRFGGIMDWPPGREVLHERDASPERLVALVLERLSPKPQRFIGADSFQSTYEEGYAAIMAWRLKRGGPTLAEVRRVAATVQTQSVGEEVIVATQKIEAAKASTQLAHLCIESFVKSGWRPRPNQAPLLAVHDKLSLESLAVALAKGGFPPSDEQLAAPDLRGLAPRHIFRYLNGRLPVEAQFRPVGRVSEPIEADIYEEAN